MVGTFELIPEVDQPQRAKLNDGRAAWLSSATSGKHQQNAGTERWAASTKRSALQIQCDPCVGARHWDATRRNPWPSDMSFGWGECEHRSHTLFCCTVWTDTLRISLFVNEGAEWPDFLMLTGRLQVKQELLSITVWGKRMSYLVVQRGTY